MIKILPINGNKINAVITDEGKLKEFITKRVNDIADDVIFLPSLNRDMSMAIFERLLLKSISEQVDITPNKGYIVSIVVDKEKMLFVATHLKNEKLGNGYTIAATLQD